MATRTSPITKQFAITGTPVHLGEQITEEGKFRITVPLSAGSSVWIGKSNVVTGSGGEYRAGSSVQLPSTSMTGWYAITDGASVTVTLECATGGADAPNWADAGTASAGGGGGGGTVNQGTPAVIGNAWPVRIANAGATGFVTPFVDGGKVKQADGDPALPWYIQGVNAGTPERLATAQLQGAGLPGAFTTGGGVKTGLVDAIPTGANVIGKIEMAANAQADGHSATIGATTDADTANTLVGRIKKLISLLPTTLGTGGGLKIDGSGTALPTSNSASSQLDGHSASIGATTDADTALTVIGRLKKLVSLVPAALVGGRFDINLGSWLGSTGAALGDNVSNPTSPLIGVAMMGFDRFSATTWNRWTMNQFGGVVQGYTGNGSGLSGAERPIWASGWDGTNKRAFLTDTSGRSSITNNRIARTAHLASTTLLAAGAFTSQTPYTIPEGVVSITAYVVYTRGAVGGQVKLRPQWANGTETAYETAVSGSAASGGTLRNQIELRELLGPIVDTTSAVTFLVQFDVPAGCTTFALYAAESGVTGTPGTCAITLTARYGS